jgi:hypothetical protein
METVAAVLWNPDGHGTYEFLLLNGHLPGGAIQFLN